MPSIRRPLFGRSVITQALALAFVLLFFAAVPGAAQSSSSKPSSKLRFEISFPETLSAVPLDGHILLGISRSEHPEPRFQLKEEEASSAQFFGLDVDAWKPGVASVIDGSTLAYPIPSLDQLPTGDYYVQAVLNVYETFHRADGHVVKLPPDMGEGQQWNQKPGNLLNRPLRVHLDAQHGGVVRIVLSEKIPAIVPPQDTKYLKHIRIQSRLLSAFWGRPTYLGACLLYTSPSPRDA